MFNFAGITHVIEIDSGPNKGKFALVGSVPIGMMSQRKPTSADIMGGRVMDDGYAYVGKAYDTIDDIKHKINGIGKLCESKTCACRKLF